MHLLQDNLKRWYQGMKYNKCVADKIMWSTFPIFPCIGYQCVLHDSLQPSQLPYKTYTSCLKTLQNLQDLFDPLNSASQESNPDEYGPRSILVEGHCGVGKTTLCMEMCVQWAEGHLFTPEELVLLLSLHDPSVHEITSDLQLAEYFTKSANMQVRLVEYLENCERAGVTIVIDGYDLLSSEFQESCYLKELIEQRKLPKAKVIVTSKPFASINFHYLVDRRIELFELETSHRNKLIAIALKDFPSSYERLQKHLYQYPNMDRLSHMPRYMAILMFLCLQHPGCLPSTASDMLKLFLLYIINHQLKATENIDEISDLPQFAQEAFKKLDQFAFTALRESKEVFLESELPEICRDDVTCYGLVHSVQSCNSAGQMKVVDQDLLVYLAARNVAVMPNNEMADCFRVSLPTLLESYHSSTPVGLSTKLHRMWSLVFEMSQLSNMLFSAESLFANTGTCASISEFIGDLYTHSDSGQAQEFKIGNGLQIHARGFTTMETEAERLLKQAKEEPFTSCLCLFQYFQGLYEFDEVMSHTFNSGVLDFSNKCLLPYQVELIAALLASLETVNGLLLSGCHIGDYGVYLFCQYLYVRDLSFNTVDLCGNNLTAASSSLISDLINHLNPHSLVLCFNNMSDIGIEDVGAAIVNNKNVKVLDISGNGITIKGTQAISGMIMILEVLDISNSDFGDDGASVLSKALSRTTTLKTLAIKQCNISEAGTIAIATALTCNCSLTVLLMNGNAIGNLGASKLSFALCHNSTLKELSLTGDQTIDYAAASELLLAVLYENNTLSDLDLPEEVNSQELLYREVETFFDDRPRARPLNLSFW